MQLQDGVSKNTHIQKHSHVASKRNITYSKNLKTSNFKKEELTF